ncbi:hypothetical protein [Eggerthella guodeyinii]|uniref:Uncharacterized protein n=1 Tax=Eggerthella guodeyinii TaxID=2690837 RepID=A0A6N7RKA2_9ACTN|nr:hypothetical protein [Eggerthella guodeyinii]MRX81735.1 hypothetical protein [Eggerthella guodeyinii]
MAHLDIQAAFIDSHGLRAGDALPDSLGIAIDRVGAPVPYASVLGESEVRVRVAHGAAPIGSAASIHAAALDLVEQVASEADGEPNAHLMWLDLDAPVPTLKRRSPEPDAIVLDGNGYEWFEPCAEPAKSGLAALAFGAFDFLENEEDAGNDGWPDDDSGPGGRQAPRRGEER